MQGPSVQQNTVQFTVKFITLESLILEASQLVYFVLYLTVLIAKINKLMFVNKDPTDKMSFF